MGLFNKKKSVESVDLIVPETPPVVVSVPDIKEYLVKEYEHTNDLMAKIEALERALDIAKETQLKYDATLVTLDEYSNRLKLADRKIADEKTKKELAQAETDRVRDELNSYKIKLNNIAITKDQIKDEIIDELKDELIKKVLSYKGHISKKIICEIIKEG